MTSTIPRLLAIKMAKQVLVYPSATYFNHDTSFGFFFSFFPFYLNRYSRSFELV
jgi:hypothetical protein